MDPVHGNDPTAALLSQEDPRKLIDTRSQYVVGGFDQLMNYKIMNMHAEIDQAQAATNNVRDILKSHNEERREQIDTSKKLNDENIRFRSQATAEMREVTLYATLMDQELQRVNAKADAVKTDIWKKIQEFEKEILG